MTPSSMIDSITAKIFFQVMRPGRQQKQTSQMSSRTSKMKEIMSNDCVNCGATGLFSRQVQTLCISLQASEQLLLSLSANLNQLIVPRQTQFKLLLVTVMPMSLAAKKVLVLMESTSLKMDAIVPSLPQSLTLSQNQLQLLKDLRKYSSFAHLGSQLAVIPTIGVPYSLDIWQYFPLAWQIFVKPGGGTLFVLILSFVIGHFCWDSTQQPLHNISFSLQDFPFLSASIFLTQNWTAFSSQEYSYR